MGSAASVSSDTPDVQLVDFTNREQFLKDCNQFFDTMQSSDGSAAKHRIYSVLNGLHQASEILNVFLLYCPEGRMNPSTFVDLCRDVKLLDKKFTAENAKTVFSAGRLSYYQGAEDSPDIINFSGFLYHVVPELTCAKNMEEGVLGDRLARHHKPSLVVQRTISFKTSMSSCTPQVSPVKKTSSGLNFQPVGESKEGGVEDEPEEKQSGAVAQNLRAVVQEANSGLEMDVLLKNQAATTIQNLFRRRIAKKRTLYLKQLKKGKRIKDAAIYSKLKSKLEKELKKAFQFYCPNDDIDREGFLWLIKDSGLYCSKYLSVDAEHNFAETIAKVELADTPRKYVPGVRYHKRFTFIVFKDVALSFVALSTGLSYEAVVNTIIKANSAD